MNRLAIFDCDGTLVDSGATIYAALKASLERNGLEVPARVRAGASSASASLKRWQRCCRICRQSSTLSSPRITSAPSWDFRTAGEVEEPLFDGVLELLDALEAEGWLLAVATGKSDRGLKHCLDLHGIHARFISLQTADRHPSKPHPSMVEQAINDAGAAPERTIVVGDTSFDMAMAVNAGAAGIGAGWGYHEAEELLDAGAVAVADQPLDVLDLIRESCRWMKMSRGAGCSSIRSSALAGSRSSSSALRSSTPISCAPGGWPQIGAVVAIMGAIDALFAPRLLKKAWDEQDRSAGQ